MTAADFDAVAATELADTVASERTRRKRRGRELQAATPQMRQAVADNPIYLRVRSALCDESPVDLDGHAARVALAVIKARAENTEPGVTFQGATAGLRAEGV